MENEWYIEKVSIPPPGNDGIDWIPISVPSVMSSREIEYSPVGAAA